MECHNQIRNQGLSRQNFRPAANSVRSRDLLRWRSNWGKGSSWFGVVFGNYSMIATSANTIILVVLKRIDKKTTRAMGGRAQWHLTHVLTFRNSSPGLLTASAVYDYCSQSPRIDSAWYHALFTSRLCTSKMERYQGTKCALVKGGGGSSRPSRTRSRPNLT